MLCFRSEAVCLTLTTYSSLFYHFNCSTDLKIHLSSGFHELLESQVAVWRMYVGGAAELML